MPRLLILIAIINWGLWGFFSKIASRSLHPIQQTLIVNFVYVAEIPILVWLLCRNNVGFNVSFKGTLFAIVSATCGVLAGLSYVYALQKADAGVTSALATSYVALTYVLSVIFLNEPFTTQRIIGLLTILLGTFLISR